MKHKTLFRFLVGLIILAFLVPEGTVHSESSTSLEKNETVYILTDTQGKILEERWQWKIPDR